MFCIVLFMNGVLCWFIGKGKGWVIVEYVMFLCVINSCNDCESVKGCIGGWMYEILCLIGCVLCVVVDIKVFGENIIVIDCDVL